MSRQERDVSGVMVGVGHQGGARYGASQRDGRSDLLKDQSENGQGVNRCPFGCNDDELDEQGYCFHLIGFSPDGKKLERNTVDEDGRIRTRAPVRKVNGRFTLVHDEKIDRALVRSGEVVLDPVVRGGTCRVYQNVARPDDYPESVSDELSDEELAAIEAEESDEDDEPEPEPVVPEPRRNRRRKPQTVAQE